MLHEGTASERTVMAYKKLLLRADRLLFLENPTVMDKSIAPPTQDKHDYLSISRYWWPNPQTPNGLPWIRKDGETNPDTQTDAVDRHRLGAMSEAVKNLSLAYFFSDDEKYAKKATSLIKTWFLDPKTRMNPHLKFGQSVPGNPKGRRSGILDGRPIVMVVPDAITILSQSPYWTTENNLNITNWFTEYLTWLTESDLGKKGSEQTNNHGSWYKFQVASLALYLGNKSLATEVVELAQQSLNDQLNNEGGQIHELTRTKSFSYSCFNLEALTSIAIIGDKIGLDMWNYTSPEEKSLSLAVNYLTPVIEGEKWPFPSKYGVDVSQLVRVLARMSTKTKSEKYADLLAEVITVINKKEPTNNSKVNVLDELFLLNSLNY